MSKYLNKFDYMRKIDPWYLPSELNKRDLGISVYWNGGNIKVEEKRFNGRRKEYNIETNNDPTIAIKVLYNVTKEILDEFVIDPKDDLREWKLECLTSEVVKDVMSYYGLRTKEQQEFLENELISSPEMVYNVVNSGIGLFYLNEKEKRFVKELSNILGYNDE